jgi:hypothetical protein
MNQIHSGKQAVSQRLPERLEGSRNGSSDLEWVTKTTRFWTGRSGIGNCLAAAPQAGNIFLPCSGAPASAVHALIRSRQPLWTMI